MQFSLDAALSRRLLVRGQLHAELSDKGTTGVPLRLQHAADGSYFRSRRSGELQRADEESGAAAPHRQGQLRLGSAQLAHVRSPARLPRRSPTTGRFRASSPADRARDTTSRYQYQNNGANVNLTGSPDYAARVVINGDTGSGCCDDRFRQFSTAAFSGPLPGSLGMESGRNYMVGCPDKTTDLAFARTFRLGGARYGTVPARDVQRASTRSSTTPGKPSCSSSARKTRRFATRSSLPMAAWIRTG